MEVFLLAFSLGIDAFAVATACGISIQNFNRRQGVKLALSFGLFQGGMTAAGAFLEGRLGPYIEGYGQIVAAILLCVIGGRMVWQGVCKKEECVTNQKLTIARLFMLSIATSIDAFAAGIGLHLFTTQILLACVIIGLMAFSMTLAGSVFGRRLQGDFSHKASLLGGLVLIALAIQSFFG